MNIVREKAIISITRHGAALASLLSLKLNNAADCYAHPDWAKAQGQKPYKGTLRETVGYCFENYSALIMIMAAGVAVRLLAPFISDKAKDPAVVVMDEQGCYAVSLLSGHLGGANLLAEEVAALAGAEAVITTASDRQGLPALDLIFRRLALTCEPKEMLTRAIASLVNGSGVSFYVENSGWLKTLSSEFKNYPDIRVKPFTSWTECDGKPFPVIVSSKLCNSGRQIMLLRPKCLWIGIGCRKGVSLQELEEALEKTLQKAQLSIKAVKGIASADVKREEKALLQLAQKKQWLLKFFAAEDLSDTIKRENLQKSKFVLEKIGAEGVCEPAAVAASQGMLLVTKQKHPKITLAVAEEI